ncbi:hypothetical protein C1I95_14830 [Micromonospora craterilacus]|uniref:Uncharacterized protein n=1 Tax=Micromonospora craterilacus TaxID=1655439 RepID=A0A2W2E651_9ACTN|nr:hypothetical protein [Micromonospora craterilacus]PZG17821.1 hypothetical protein C1I95_14830 [Micromonospora craterilacus]
MDEMYVDEDGVAHAWDDVVPHDPEAESAPDPDEPPYTYRDLVTDRAEAQGMTVGEYLDGDPWGFDPPDDL